MHMMPSMFHGDVDPLQGFTFEECDRLTGDAADQVVTWERHLRHRRNSGDPAEDVPGQDIRLPSVTQPQTRYAKTFA